MNDRRATDRREAPRRAEDAQLHYATQTLLAVALAASADPCEAAYDALDIAAEQYRAACSPERAARTTAH